MYAKNFSWLPWGPPKLENLFSIYLWVSEVYLKKEAVIINPTALSQHAVSNSHSFDLDYTKILTHEWNKFKKNVLEMIYINKSSFDFRTDTNNLSHMYNDIIYKPISS